LQSIVIGSRTQGRLVGLACDTSGFALGLLVGREILTGAALGRALVDAGSIVGGGTALAIVATGVELTAGLLGSTCVDRSVVACEGSSEIAAVDVTGSAGAAGLVVLR
jgi:hypothetical protein